MTRHTVELIFGKAAVVGFLNMVLPKVKPPVVELTADGRETLLALIDRKRHPLLVRVREYRIFGS